MLLPQGNYTKQKAMGGYSKYTEHIFEFAPIAL